MKTITALCKGGPLQTLSNKAKTDTALCKGGPLQTLSNKAKTDTALCKGGPLHTGTFTYRYRSRLLQISGLFKY